MSAQARLTELGIELPTPDDVPPACTPARCASATCCSCRAPRRCCPAVASCRARSAGRSISRLGARPPGWSVCNCSPSCRVSWDHSTRSSESSSCWAWSTARPGFNNTPGVIDGCSELFIEVFGEAGRSARSAVGMAELPFDIAVEIEAIVQVRRTRCEER